MLKNVEYWIIKTENEKFLDFNQTGDKDLDVYEVDELDAFAFETKISAQQEIDHIMNRNGMWNYFGDFSKPVKPVKLFIQYEIKEEE